MVTLDIEQQTQEWFEAKAGVPSASNFNKIVTTKGEISKQAEKYLYQLAGERITGIREEIYTNQAMQRGCELEAEAREYYELVNGVEVKQVGICYPNEDKKYACSPDGLIGDDGMIEIKCPLLSTHVSYLVKGKLPSDYFQQTQGQLFVTSRKWVDFMSYYPGVKPLLIRVYPDEEFIKKLSVALDKFCADLEKVVLKIK